MTTAPVELLLGKPRFSANVAGGNDRTRWVALIARHGVERAAGYVNGDFAVALSLDDGSVFMAVDRFATQTLCLRIAEGALLVAERADEAAGADADVDPQALFDYLYFHVIPSPRTAFQGVLRLPAAHWAHFSNGALRSGRYWTPRFQATSRPNLAALKEEFRTLLATTAARQLDGSPAACFLSGGTDSSTVAGMIGQVTGSPAVAYSIGFGAEGYDEMAYARIAARRFGCTHREHYVTPEDLVRDIPKVAASFDQPFGNSSVLPAYQCALLARSDGVSRLLAGDGGDELFGGNSRYATQRLFGIYQHVPPWLRHGVMEPFFGLKALAHVPVLKRGAGYIRQANIPLPDRGQTFNLIRRLGYDSVFTPYMLCRVQVDGPDQQQRAIWAEAQCDDEIDRHLAFDWRYTLAESDLPKVCGATRLAGLSVGFPMLDNDLVDFSMRLPAAYKLRGFKLRWFFKEALVGFLPDEIIKKKKQGFGLPFGVWMVGHTGLRQLAEESLHSLGERQIVRPSMIRNLLDTLLPQHPHYYGTLVWIFMMLEQWLRAHRPRFRLEA